ncbi:phage major capsid protein, partial [Proteus mirabilis]|uniref:phage major capsid protein n=1 Tax=Proteus mirabilis TaxID=584 RepID=UPI003919610F
GIVPKGSKAGLEQNQLGEVTLQDDNGGKYQGYRTHFKWENGLTVRDWRYVVRIANIDLSKFGQDPEKEDALALPDLLIQA